jgi:hypothetical protein
MSSPSKTLPSARTSAASRMGANFVTPDRLHVHAL